MEGLQFITKAFVLVSLMNNVQSCIIHGHAVKLNHALVAKPVDFYLGFSLMDCFSVCKDDTRCVSFNYVEVTKRCEMLDVNHCEAYQAFIHLNGSNHYAMLCLPVNRNARQAKTTCLESGLCTAQKNACLHILLVHYYQQSVTGELHIESMSGRRGTTTCEGSDECPQNMTCDVNVCRCMDGLMMDSEGTCVKDYGHIGTEFVLGFGENSRRQSSAEELVLHIASYSSENVTVHVTSPAIVSIISGQLSPGECIKILLPDIRVTTDGQIEARGIRIVASGRVSVTAVNGKRHGIDSFDVMPLEFAGTQYRVMCPPINGQLSQLLIVSTEALNTIRFTTPDITTFSALINGHTYGPNEEFVVTLSELETYRISSAHDFSGITIYSLKAVILTVGSPAAGINLYQSSADNLEALLPDVKTLGKAHIIFSSPGSWRPKTYKLMSVEPNTNIQIRKQDGTDNAFVMLGRAGSTFVFRLIEKYGSVISDKPVIVTGYLETELSSDPSSVIFPSVEQFSRMELRFQTINRPEKSNSSHYLTIAIKEEFTTGLLLDGLNIEKYHAVWFPVPGLEQYVATSIQVAHTTHLLSHVSGHPPVLAVCYGFYRRETYAYVIGRSYRNLMTDDN